jgi:hypothetical protein
MERGDLNHRNIKRSVFGKHRLKGDPDAMINSALDALRFDPCFDEMLPDLHGEFGGVVVGPVVFVD